MLESLPTAVVVGILLGFLSGLGIGGGSLLILWLTMVLGMQQEDARTINLLFFLPSAGSAIYFQHQTGTANWKKLQPAIIAGCSAAAVFSFIGTIVDTQLLKKLFGVLLIATGLRELLYKPRTK